MRGGFLRLLIVLHAFPALAEASWLRWIGGQIAGTPAKNALRIGDAARGRALDRPPGENLINQEGRYYCIQPAQGDQIVIIRLYGSRGSFGPHSETVNRITLRDRFVRDHGSRPDGKYTQEEMFASGRRVAAELPTPAECVRNTAEARERFAQSTR